MCHVLIIEDEPFVALGIELVLGDAGATSFDIAVSSAHTIVVGIALIDGGTRVYPNYAP